MKSIEWIDNMVNAAELLRAMAKTDYRVLLSPKEFHMTENEFDSLVERTQAVVTYNPNWYEKNPKTGEAFFMYRGYKFFGLWDKKGATK